MASVDCKIDKIFFLTNHVDWDWTTNAEIKHLASKNTPRSTSVGDMILDTEDGLVYGVAGNGFKVFTDLKLE